MNRRTAFALCSIAALVTACAHQPKWRFTDTVDNTEYLLNLPPGVVFSEQLSGDVLQGEFQFPGQTDDEQFSLSDMPGPLRADRPFDGSVLDPRATMTSISIDGVRGNLMDWDDETGRWHRLVELQIRGVRSTSTHPMIARRRIIFEFSGRRSYQTLFDQVVQSFKLKVRLPEGE